MKSRLLSAFSLSNDVTDFDNIMSLRSTLKLAELISFHPVLCQAHIYKKKMVTESEVDSALNQEPCHKIMQVVEGSAPRILNLGVRLR